MAPEKKQQVPASEENKKPEETEQSKNPGVAEPPQAATAATVPEENAGRALLNAAVSASKSLQSCIAQLESSVALLEDMRSDSATLSSLTAGVNYYASVSKASQASQTSNQKALAWDWLSNSSDKVPMKDVVRSIRFHAENTTKASYELVTVAKDILETVQTQREIMTEQCSLVKVVAEGAGQNCERTKRYHTKSIARRCPSCSHGSFSCWWCSSKCWHGMSI